MEQGYPQRPTVRGSNDAFRVLQTNILGNSGETSQVLERAKEGLEQRNDKLERVDKSSEHLVEHAKDFRESSEMLNKTYSKNCCIAFFAKRARAKKLEAKKHTEQSPLIEQDKQPVKIASVYATRKK